MQLLVHQARQNVQRMLCQTTQMLKDGVSSPSNISLLETSLLEGGSTHAKGIAGTAGRLGTWLATVEVK
jgi:hypothetical protein